jgi:FkbM family methyltransferase
VYNGVIAELLIEQMPKARFYLFEPQDWAAEQLRGKFGHLPNVKVCEFALGDRSGTFQMAFYGQDTCSFMRGPTPLTPGYEAFFDGRMEEFTEVMEQEGIEEVYYAFVNVESYEHVLLPYLERTGWMDKLQTIGMSWHLSAGPITWLGEPTVPHEDLQGILAKRHDLVLEIDNWQSWAKKQESPTQEAKTSKVEASEEQPEKKPAQRKRATRKS